MRRRVGVLVSIVMVVALGGVVGAAAPALADGSTCSGVQAGTFPGDVTVLAGQECDLGGAIVHGSVVAQPGSVLTVTGGSHVFGNINGTGAAVQVRDSTVEGYVAITNAHDFPGPNDTFIVQVVVCDTTVGGSLTVSGSTGRAPVEVGGSLLCGSSVNHIGGNLVFQNNKPSQGPGGNLIANNVVGMVLYCAGNTPAPTVSNNTAGRTAGQCVPQQQQQL